MYWFLRTLSIFLISIVSSLSFSVSAQDEPEPTGIGVDTFSGIQELFVLDEQSLQVDAVALSPNENIIASGGNDGLVILWDLDSGEIIGQFERHEDAVESLVFNADGSRLASGDKDGLIIIWFIAEYADGQINLRTLENHTSRITDLAFHPVENLLVSASFDGTTRIWDLDESSVNTIDLIMPWVVSYSPDGALLAVSDGNKVELLEGSPEDLSRYNVYEGSDQTDIRGISVHPMKPLIAIASGLGSLVLWNYESDEIAEIEDVVGIYDAMEFSNDGSLLFVGDGSRLRVLDVESQQFIFEEQFSRESIDNIDINLANSLIAIASGKEVRILEIVNLDSE